LGDRPLRKVSYLLTACAATHITLDPRIEKLRAIRCYEKCGFQKVKVLPGHELHEGAYCGGAANAQDVGLLSAYSKMT
jgi:hypothetical protein